MFDRFTDCSRKVMALARKEAQRFHHDFIGTEHILLGLIQEGSGVAANVLKNLGVEINKVRSEMEQKIKPGPGMVIMGQLPFTPGAKKVLELSMEEANQLGHNYIGTEHLLLGMLREGEDPGARMLHDLGVNLARAHEEVLDLLGATIPASTAPVPINMRRLINHRTITAVSTMEVIDEQGNVLGRLTLAREQEIKVPIGGGRIRMVFPQEAPFLDLNMLHPRDCGWRVIFKDQNGSVRGAHPPEADPRS